MLFHSFDFWVFFPLVLLAFYLSPQRVGRLVLLVASYVFYMWWDWRFAGLILASTLVDYGVGLRLPHATGRRKRTLLVASLATNLGLLGFFKYYNFFSGSLASALGIDAAAWHLDIVLPVGISFYTFQSMSYSIDVYRGLLAPVRNFFDFALFVAFFPQLVAGPIVRAREFFPQLNDWKAPSGQQLQRGIHRILFGLIKKMVFADHFAQVADLYFADPAGYPGAIAAWSGTLAFAMQIFFDFSGYTDIARGCALLLGFEFPINFRRPYLSRNITEFWQRWHISLSSWLRDYLYIPLGGNRISSWFTYRNLAITMLLGGLWHGASWTFVIWGAYHGILLAIHRALGSRMPAGARWMLPFDVAATFGLVLIGWVFFRAETLGDAMTILSQMFGGSSLSLLTPGHWILVGSSLLLAILEERWRVIDRLATAPPGWQIPLYVLCFFVLELCSAIDEKIPFVYFQF